MVSHDQKNTPAAVARLASLVAFRYDSASAKKPPVPAMTWLSVFIERRGVPSRFVRLGMSVGASLGMSLALAGCGALFDDSYESTTAEVTELAEQGDAAAQAALGQRLEAGLGTPRDVDRALAWYRESAMHPVGHGRTARRTSRRRASQDGREGRRQERSSADETR